MDSKFELWLMSNVKFCHNVNSMKVIKENLEKEITKFNYDPNRFYNNLDLGINDNFHENFNKFSLIWIYCNNIICINEKYDARNSWSSYTSNQIYEHFKEKFIHHINIKFIEDRKDIILSKYVSSLYDEIKYLTENDINNTLTEDQRKKSIYLLAIYLISSLDATTQQRLSMTIFYYYDRISIDDSIREFMSKKINSWWQMPFI